MILKVKINIVENLIVICKSRKNEGRSARSCFAYMVLLVLERQHLSSIIANEMGVGIES